MQRSTALIVFGILNLVFAALGVFGILASLMVFLMPQNPNIPNPALDLMRENVAYATFLYVSSLLGVLAAIALALAGIGLLLMKSWGRYLSIGYAVYAIVMAIVGMVVNYFLLLKPMMERIGRLPPGPEQAGMMGGAIGSTVGGCFGLIYPMVLLFFMYRPSVIAACRPHRNPDQFHF